MFLVVHGMRGRTTISHSPIWRWLLLTVAMASVWSSRYKSRILITPFLISFCCLGGRPVRVQWGSRLILTDEEDACTALAMPTHDAGVGEGAAVNRVNESVKRKT